MTLVALENAGREAETYLRHMLDRPPEKVSRGYTVFCQGKPFEHSPDFLDLLEETSQWKPRRLRVRTETFSPATMATTQFRDTYASTFTRVYREDNGLGPDTNLSQYFLEQCGLPAIAATAGPDRIGRFCYGAIFAVADSVLAEFPVDAVRRMHNLSTAGVAPYMFERLWLHIFGLTFLLPGEALG